MIHYFFILPEISFLRLKNSEIPFNEFSERFYYAHPALLVVKQNDSRYYNYILEGEMNKNETC